MRRKHPTHDSTAYIGVKESVAYQGCPLILKHVDKVPELSLPELDKALYLGTLAVPPELDGRSIGCYDGEGDGLYLVLSSDGETYDLFTTGTFPDSVVLYLDDEDGAIEYEVPLAYSSLAARDPKFVLAPSHYVYNKAGSEKEYVGSVSFDRTAVSEVQFIVYDGEDDAFWFEDGWDLWTAYVESELEHEDFDVSVYIKYVDAVSGQEVEIRKVFKVYGTSVNMLTYPYVKYIENLSSRVDTAVQVTLYGGNFNEELNVQLSLSRPDGTEWRMDIPHSDLAFSIGEGRWDSVSFVMNKALAYTDGSGKEVCGTYNINLGYGEGDGFDALAGTGDPRMALENNLGLIRYKYSAANEESKKTASAGNVATTDASCFYTSSVSMIYDTTDDRGNPLINGGAAGKYGKTMYVKIPPDADCTKVKYYRIRMKYNNRLDYRYGEMVLDGVSLRDGDIVWLAGQMDGTDGLWVVRADAEWTGLKSLSEGVDPDTDADPCEEGHRTEPLVVDWSVFPDLGATVDDKVDLNCDQDVPVKYGSQVVCNRTLVPGDLVYLTGQSDGMDGVWEVTCAEWIYRGPVSGVSGEKLDMSDEILVQNDIDFCACADGGGGGVFNIEYYYLNAACYLATATRKVKVICSRTGGLFPGNGGAILTDYSITIGAEKDLVVDTHVTAGDVVEEDCVHKPDTYFQQSSVKTEEILWNCGEMGRPIVAPTCEVLCDCPRYYVLGKDYAGSLGSKGFSIVFWQAGEGGWHLYAYVAEGTYDSGMSYYVYHIHSCGIVKASDVDQNADVYIKDERGLPTSKRTKDAWFVEHTGPIADGFGMVDDHWRFAVKSEDGTPTGEYTTELGPDTLYQRWQVYPETTKILAHREYREEDGKKIPVDVAGMSGVYGFSYLDNAITPERLCEIFNKVARIGFAAGKNCPCQESVSHLVTDQSYDESGETMVPSDDVRSHGESLFLTDDEEEISD